MPIQNNPSRDFDQLTSALQKMMFVLDQALIANDPAPAPAPSAISSRIGRVNTALAELNQRRRTLNARQEQAVDEMNQFYLDTPAPRTNGDLYNVPESAQRRQPQQDQITLRRRASFLLNNVAFAELPHAINEIADQAGMIGYSNATLMVNAIANSAKSQVEHVNDAALQDAQRGDRICPMTLQPAKFNEFLRQHGAVLDRLVVACQSPAHVADSVIERELQALTKGYFQHSTDYPGAPVIRPDALIVNINSAQKSSIRTNAANECLAVIHINSQGAKKFCRDPLPQLVDCEGMQDMSRAHLLQGFENHSPAKKHAALLIQLMLQEVSEVQEILGLGRPNPSHGEATRRAALRTLEEFDYRGSEALKDSIVGADGDPPQRVVATQLMQVLPHLATSFQKQYNTPLITNDEINKWVDSPEMMMNMRGLAEPSSRLQLLASPLTGQALLNTPTFKNPH